MKRPQCMVRGRVIIRGTALAVTQDEETDLCWGRVVFHTILPKAWFKLQTLARLRLPPMK